MGVRSALFEGDVLKDKIRIFECMYYGFGYICLPNAILAVNNGVELTGEI
jgi:hypothetical protein